jgi:hypothetical protein
VSRRSSSENALDTDAALATCESYHIGATLEDAGNNALDSDSDAAAGTVCTGGGTDFSSTSADAIYDIKP